jgi:hypothetical protein
MYKLREAALANDKDGIRQTRILTLPYITNKRFVS